MNSKYFNIPEEHQNELIKEAFIVEGINLAKNVFKRSGDDATKLIGNIGNFVSQASKGNVNFDRAAKVIGERAKRVHEKVKGNRTFVTDLKGNTTIKTDLEQDYDAFKNKYKQYESIPVLGDMLKGVKKGIRKDSESFGTSAWESVKNQAGKLLTGGEGTKAQKIFDRAATKVAPSSGIGRFGELLSGGRKGKLNKEFAGKIKGEEAQNALNSVLDEESAKVLATRAGTVGVGGLGLLALNNRN